MEKDAIVEKIACLLSSEYIKQTKKRVYGYCADWDKTNILFSHLFLIDNPCNIDVCDLIARYT